MTTQAERMGRAVGLAAAAAGLALGLAAVGYTARAAQPAGERKTIPAMPADEIAWIGASECKSCHGEETPEKVELYQETKGHTFVRLWENKVWQAHDLHAEAYKNLLTDRNKGKSKSPANRTATVMEDNLRKAYRKDDYTVTADTRCLACHSSSKYPVTEAAVPKWVPTSFVRSETEGVGCEMCHGHGGAYRTRHRDPLLIDGDPAADGATKYVPWREADPARKAAWGLVNLRDPAVATARCASCHVGNVTEGRFVLHEFYAAGHPPLPPLDFVAYTREQPRHWGLASEMPFLTRLAKDNADKAWKTFHYKAGESVVARRFAESAVATLRANLDLTAQLAADAEKTGAGLDFSAFDCYACHHDLKYPSDRQARGYVGPPGRPLFRPAPFALARVVADHAAGAKGGEGLAGRSAALLEVEKELARAFGAKTFGDPTLIKQAVANGTKLSDDTLAAVRKLTYDPAAREKLLDAVVAAAGRPVADPEVAQLYAWAYETLALDGAGPPPSPKDAPQPPPPAVAALHAKLSEFVVTRLRPGAKFTYEVTPTTTHPSPTLEPVDRRLQDRMRTFNAFQADRFRAAFADLRPKK